MGVEESWSNMISYSWIYNNWSFSSDQWILRNCYEFWHTLIEYVNLSNKCLYTSGNSVACKFIYQIYTVWN